MHSQNQRHALSHLIGSLVEFHSCLVTIQQTHEPFGALQQFKVVFYRHHEQFIYVDVDELFVIATVCRFYDL